MKTQTQKPQTAKDFMQSLGLKFDETAKCGIRFEFKQNNFEIDGFRVRTSQDATLNSNPKRCAVKSKI